MKTLRLQVDTLEVESFSPGAEEATAIDFLATRPQACDPFSLPPRCS